jgi:arginine:pyruvate transaminase
VIVLEPYYVTYPATFTASGARLVAVAVGPENNFQPDPEHIAAVISPATRMLVLNSPNNPTAAIYRREPLQALVELCRQRDIWIVSDEVYAELAVPEQHVSLCSLAGANDLTITIGSLSKSHRMTGWRCGWTVAPESLSEHFYNLCLCMSYGLPGFIQDAALRALQDDIDIASRLRTALTQRYHMLSKELAGLSEIALYGNPGGMFAMLDIRALGIDGTTFARTLLDKHNVSLLPCDGFGNSGRGLLRISLCEHEDRLREACQRLCRLVASL